MKTKLAWLALGTLLGASVTQLIEYREVTLPCARALAAARASVVEARKTVAAARAEQLSERAGFTIIEEIDAPAPPASPSNAAIALGILGAISGRNLSGVAPLLPQPEQAPQPTSWHGFAIRGHVQPLATPWASRAFYTFCATEKTCTSPAVIPVVTQADLVAVPQ